MRYLGISIYDLRSNVLQENIVKDIDLKKTDFSHSAKKWLKMFCKVVSFNVEF